jgi:putative tryptophan/tyrosine transport system substrate-binding protein
MRRREFIGGLGSAAAWAQVTHAQQSSMRRIAIWIARTDSPDAHVMAFRQRLQALGWTEGQNILMDYRWIVGDHEQIRATAKEIVDQRPEVILAQGTLAVAALSRESGAIPIVFVNVSDPIGSGFVTSLARPGGMITGFTSNEPTLGGKWLEALAEIARDVRRVGLMFNPDTTPYAEAFLRQAEASAGILALETFAVRIRDPGEIEQAMTTLANEPGGGLIVIPELTTNSASDLIIESAARHRIPAIYAWEYEAAGGGLMSYGVDVAESFRGGAVYVDRILRGSKPAELPVQAPTKFRFVLNLATAKALNLTVPLATLLRADEVIE